MIQLKIEQTPKLLWFRCRNKEDYKLGERTLPDGRIFIAEELRKEKMISAEPDSLFQTVTVYRVGGYYK